MKWRRRSRPFCMRLAMIETIRKVCRAHRINLRYGSTLRVWWIYGAHGAPYVEASQ